MTSKHTIVSVVVPTYDRWPQLQACIKALAVQTLSEPWDVVIVDDGSQEPLDQTTADLISSRGWRLIRQANAGPAAARNLGVRVARGQFIAFTDDDCRPEPGWLETLLRTARERSCALVGGTTVNGLTGELFASTSQMIVDFVYEHFNADGCNAYFLASNNVLCSREQFLNIGGFDESFPRAGAEDRDFCDRWRMRRWPMIWCPEAIVEHRHSQTFRKFIDLYIRYGRGAYRYQTSRKARGSGSIREDLAFHKTLLRRIRDQLPNQRSIFFASATLMALFLWQIANAAGFALEAVMHIKQRFCLARAATPVNRGLWRR